MTGDKTRVFLLFDASWLKIDMVVLNGVERPNMVVFFLDWTNQKMTIPSGLHLAIQPKMEKLDDGWPESVEEQSLLLLVWRH